MKVSAIVLAAAATVVVALAVDIPSCDQDKINQVSKGPNAVECKRKYKEASASLPPPATGPEALLRALMPNFTDVQLDSICSYRPCVDYYKELKAAQPNECVYFGGNPQYLFYRDEINRQEDQCKAKGKTPVPESVQTPTMEPEHC